MYLSLVPGETFQCDLEQFPFEKVAEERPEFLLAAVPGPGDCFSQARERIDLSGDCGRGFISRKFEVSRQNLWSLTKPERPHQHIFELSNVAGPMVCSKPYPGCIRHFETGSVCLDGCPVEDAIDQLA